MLTKDIRVTITPATSSVCDIPILSDTWLRVKPDRAGVIWNTRVYILMTRPRDSSFEADWMDAGIKVLIVPPNMPVPVKQIPANIGFEVKDIPIMQNPPMIAQ